MKYTTKVFSLLVFSCISFSACKKDNTTTDNGESIPCNTLTITYSDGVLPIINSHCAYSGCHDASTKAGGISCEGYENTKTNIEYWMRTIRHESGVDPMPEGKSKLPDEDIRTIQCWIDAGSQNN